MSEQTIRRSDIALSAKASGTLLLMNMERGRYHGLNRVAERIWDLLAAPTTPQRIVDDLVAEYEISAQDCTREVATFLDALRERGLLTEAQVDAPA